MSASSQNRQADNISVISGAAMISNSRMRAAPLNGLATHLLERTNEAVLLFDPSDFSVIDASDAALKVVGSSRTEISATTLDQLLIIESLESAERFWSEIGSQSPVSESPTARVRTKASARLYRCDVSDQFLSGTERLRVLTLRDSTTSRDEFEDHRNDAPEDFDASISSTADLRPPDETYKQLLKDVRAIIWESNLPYNGMVYVSEQLETILGFKPHEWLGIPDAWANSIHEDDRKQAVEFCEAQSAVGEDHDFVYRAVARDGRTVWIHDHVHVIKDASGRPIKLRGVMTDITARKIAEEEVRRRESHLRLLVENVPICIHSIDQNRKIGSINPSGVKIANCKDASDIVGRDYLGFVAPSDLDRIESLLEKAFQGERSHYEFTCLTRGGPRIFRSNFIPIQEPNGAIRQVIGTSEDVTERQKTSDRLREREAQLAHVNRLSTMGEMVAGIAHELNQPLYCIVNFAKAISARLDHQEELDLDTLRDWSNQIHTSATLAGQIIRRLRRFVSQEPGVSQSVDLHEITDDAVELIDHAIRRARVVVRREYDASEAIVRADVVQIQQVIINLLVNAVEAIESGDGNERDILIGTKLDGDRIVLTVADTGCGLPKDLQKSLFNAFVSTKEKGMGMGLAISTTIVESFDGRLTASSNEKGGATFEISLPNFGEAADV